MSLSHLIYSTTASIWSFDNSSIAPTISSTATLPPLEKRTGFDSLSMVDVSTRISEHTGTSENSYAQHIPQARDLECRAAEQV